MKLTLWAWTSNGRCEWHRKWFSIRLPNIKCKINCLCNSQKWTKWTTASIHIGYYIWFIFPKSVIPIQWLSYYMYIYIYRRSLGVSDTVPLSSCCVGACGSLCSTNEIYFAFVLQWINSSGKWQQPLVADGGTFPAHSLQASPIQATSHWRKPSEAKYWHFLRSTGVATCAIF